MAEPRFEVGLFAVTAGSGLSMTLSEDRWQATWPNVSEVARIADEGGIDFMLPLQTWRGYGGETNPTGWCFETFTIAASIAALTKRLRIFCTVHVPFIHPTYAARAIATIDHISAGRVGVNIVCGWRPDEFAMFGLADYPHERRYDHGTEWVKAFESLLEGSQPVDFDGEFYQIKNGVCAPQSVQRPRPILISAGYSEPGREFAVNHCDGTFTIFSNPKISKDQIATLKERASSAGRSIKVYTAAHVVCREDREQAEEYYRLVADELADQGAINNYAATKQIHAPVLAKLQRAQKIKMAAGAGTYPIVGNYDDAIEKLNEIRNAGFDGVTLTFVNYLNELPDFLENVLPHVSRVEQ